MTVPRSCTDYWLDTASGTFRGDFEGMYRAIADPWGCEAGKSSLNNQIFLEVIFAGGRRFANILDIGSGLGGLLSNVHARNGGGNVLGLDVSPTAVARAKERYPPLTFECRNVVEHDVGRAGFDLVTISEVLWYVLADLSTFFDRVAAAMAPGGTLAIHQYFPAAQKFGCDVLDGLQGFLRFMDARADFVREHVYTNHHRDGLVLLSTFVKER